MNGIHDLGGMHGLGAINPEPNEPVFHAGWERRVFGVMMATFGGGHYNVDQFRHAIERMPAGEYLRSSYYEHWLHAMETLLVEGGAVGAEELRARQAALAGGGA
ncbi:SH3-like domain-containing protein [Paracraurococcus lichenis]|uniref:Nitrile hydratase subunit beta n=1 Tax=Paracraurococcus lichenis TaxID=3064888 RepID=A0ABT9E0T1_9PROT|nr:SH3-like domain-containing protein [Paracraurococcus sp. LOR1-02]MDO9709754.1 nitrile hydratase subunit beta [Paracraurococcus sp. LOR1-02]